MNKKREIISKYKLYPTYKIMQSDVKKNNLHEYGRFTRLVQSVQFDKAKEYYTNKLGKSLPPFKINMMVENTLREYILESGFDLEEYSKINK